MAKFSTSILLSIVGFAFTATLTLAQDPLAILQNPDLLSPETMCGPMCGATCRSVQLTCTDIPDLVDCAQLDQMCNSQCEQLCGCLNDCSTDCLADYPCSDNPENSISQIGCLSQRLTCKGTCQMNCPVTLMFQGVAASVQMLMAQVAQLMSPPAAK